MGRVTLADETARMLVYIIMNLRALKYHYASVAAVYEPQSFRLGWGWQPATRDAAALLVNAEVQAAPSATIIAETARLHAAVAELSIPLPAAAAAAAAPPLRRSPRKNAAAGPAEGGEARGAKAAIVDLIADTAAESDMLTCWRCPREFQRGKGSPEDPLGCGRCQHFAGLAGAAQTDLAAAATEP